MMVNETKAKARVRALREPSHTDPICTPFTITQHIRSFIFCPGNAPIELPAKGAMITRGCINSPTRLKLAKCLVKNCIKDGISLKQMQ